MRSTTAISSSNSCTAKSGAQLAAHSHGVAIDTIEHICEEEGIDCAFARVDGYLVRGEGDPHADVLATRIRRCAARGDRRRTHWKPRRARSNVSAPALRFPRQARFDALAYTTGLARAIVRMGGRIHTHSHAVRVDGGTNAGVTTDAGARVQCEHVVVAANVPFNDRVAIHTKQSAYRTYVVALRLDPGTVEDALLWDTQDPYHYVRVRRDAQRHVVARRRRGSQDRAG